MNVEECKWLVRQAILLDYYDEYSIFSTLIPCGFKYLCNRLKGEFGDRYKGEPIDLDLVKECTSERWRAN